MMFVRIRTADLERVGRMRKEHMPKQFDIRLRVFREDPAFGKGVAQLMELIEQKGSFLPLTKRWEWQPARHGKS